MSPSARTRITTNPDDGPKGKFGDGLTGRRGAATARRQRRGGFAEAEMGNLLWSQTAGRKVVNWIAGLYGLPASLGPADGRPCQYSGGAVHFGRETTISRTRRIPTRALSN